MRYVCRIAKSGKRRSEVSDLGRPCGKPGNALATVQEFA